MSHVTIRPIRRITQVALIDPSCFLLPRLCAVPGDHLECGNAPVPLLR